MNKTFHKIYVGLFLVVGISVTILLAINGYQYYTTPLEERFFSPDHIYLKPSGDWGHGFGIIGTLDDDCWCWSLYDSQKVQEVF